MMFRAWRKVRGRLGGALTAPTTHLPTRGVHEGDVDPPQEPRRNGSRPDARQWLRPVLPAMGADALDAAAVALAERHGAKPPLALAEFSAATPKRRLRETGKTVRFAARLVEVIHRAPPAVDTTAFYGQGDFARFSRDEITRRRQLRIASRTCITSSAIAWAEPEPGSPRPRLARSDATVRSLPSPLARSPSLRGGQVWPAGWEDASEERLE